MTTPSTPSVLFVCVKNGGKSQMAAGLMRKIAGNTVTVDSAGTKPGPSINALSAETFLEVGVDITEQVPKQLNDDLIAAADRVIVGIERMRLVRDDINHRVTRLAQHLNNTR
jgi:arsenate-mycothiol transferase